MSSRDDPLVVDQRAATVMVADVDGNLPWLRVGCTFIATHNLVICRGWSYESNMNKKRNRQLKLLTNQQEMKADKLLDWIFGFFFWFSLYPQVHENACRLVLPAALRRLNKIRPIILQRVQAWTGHEWPVQSLHLYFFPSVFSHTPPHHLNCYTHCLTICSFYLEGTHSSDTFLFCQNIYTVATM